MKIGLFIPCYINAVYPHVGIACYKLLVSLEAIKHKASVLNKSFFIGKLFNIGF